MTSHALITDAENAIATGRMHAAVSRTDPDHEAAVELMARGLLVDRVAFERELRLKLATEIDAAIEELFDSRVDGLERRMGLRQAYAIVLLRNHPAADDTAQVAVDGSPGDLFDPKDSAGGDV